MSSYRQVFVTVLGSPEGSLSTAFGWVNLDNAVIRGEGGVVTFEIPFIEQGLEIEYGGETTD